jgi:hypothetical protein
MVEVYQYAGIEHFFLNFLLKKGLVKGGVAIWGKNEKFDSGALVSQGLQDHVFRVLKNH